MEKKSNLWFRLSKFCRRNAYYILLIACIGVVATVVAVTVSGEDVHVDEKHGDDVVVDVPGDNTDPVDVVVDEPDDGQQDVPVVTKPIEFVMPVVSTSIKDYSMDTLVFSQTNKQWECHNGVDFFADNGETVTAVLDGVVESVNEDILMGNVVTIDHGNGLKTVYANMGTMGVKTGDSVKQGDSIGTVGNSGLIEVSDGDHLHFATTVNGAYVDPNDYFLGENK